VPDPLAAAKTFMAALEANDAEKAAAVCAEDVAIQLPGGDRQLEGREGAKQLIRMAPPFVRVVREEAVMGTTVILRGLTRSPGHLSRRSTPKDARIGRRRFPGSRIASPLFHATEIALGLYARYLESGAFQAE